jgi:signal transduction histidine kinase
MTQFSLYTRLLRMTSIPLVLGLIAIGIYSYLAARAEAENIYDAQLAHFAQVIGLLAHHEVEAGNISSKVIRMQEGDFAIPYQKDFAYRVWLKDRLLLHSENAVGFGKKMLSAGFADKYINNFLWRFYVLHEDNLTIEVAEDYHIRRDLVKQVGISIVVPLFLIFPILVAAVWYGVRYGISPLHNLSELIRRQTPENLNPVQLERIPKEVLPLVTALNHLMMQVNEAIDREKRFTRYAAHEMRTPLAALKTQIQVALREKDAATRKELLQDVLGGVDRATHLLEQLLLLARAQQQDIVKQQVDMSHSISTLIAAFHPIVVHKNQQLTASIAPDIFMDGNPELLTILVRNLLDNACKYSPENATITLKLEAQHKHGFSLRVSNSPVSLSQEQAQRMFDPFYRASHQEDTPQGAGLGLAIVSWIVRTHHLTLAHQVEGQSFTVSVSI